jgi:hypothetical protein
VLRSVKYSGLISPRLAAVIRFDVCCCFFGRDLSSPRKGDPVPKRSATFRLNADPAKIAKAERADGPADGAAWFVDFPEVDLFEETIGLGSYGRTLTILTTVDALPDEDDREEEAALGEGWRPGFRR